MNSSADMGSGEAEDSRPDRGTGASASFRLAFLPFAAMALVFTLSRVYFFFGRGIRFLGAADIGHDPANRIVPFGIAGR